MLKDTSIVGAQRILINIKASTNLPLWDIQEVVNYVKEKADPDVKLKFGTALDPEMEDSLQVTVIAAGFQKEVINLEEVQKKDGNKGKNEDVIKLSEWGDVMDHAPKQSEDHLGRRNSLDHEKYLRSIPQKNHEDYLEFPTVLRDSKPSFESDPLKRNGSDGGTCGAASSKEL
jgi:cell division protein FtsZ